MTEGNESHGSADLPEVWKELPSPDQMRPSVLVPLVTCKPCPESVPDLAKVAGLESGTCGSFHMLNPPFLSWVTPGGSLVWLKETVVQWLGAWPLSSES